MRTARHLVVVALAAILGCSGGSKPYKTAAVSGRVTLDGRPLAGARVTFQPVHDPQAGLMSGPEAHGVTDADGNYALTTVFDDTGATIGRNRVMISTRRLERPPHNPDGPLKEVASETVPNKYFTEKAPLYFDVPAGGTKAANFELTGK
jgi:hypothetical protein